MSLLRNKTQYLRLVLCFTKLSLMLLQMISAYFIFSATYLFIIGIISCVIANPFHKDVGKNIETCIKTEDSLRSLNLVYRLIYMPGQCPNKVRYMGLVFSLEKHSLLTSIQAFVWCKQISSFKVLKCA